MRAVALAVAIAIAGVACGDDAPNRAAATSSSSAASDDRTFEQSTDGLEEMLGALVNAVRANNTDEINAITKTFALPDPKAWFERTFGSDTGAKLFAEYEPVVGQFAQISTVIVGLIKSGQTDIRVEVFEEAGNGEATGYQNLALAAMKEPTPLYSARFTRVEDASGFHVWSFVYDGGTFRWVGKMKAVREAAPDDPDLLELRARLARQVK